MVKFDKVQVKLGLKHELEHTKSSRIAKKIATDHLKHDPAYYTHLEGMEKFWKKRAKRRKK